MESVRRTCERMIQETLPCARHSEDVFANGRAHVNGIENFWGIAKIRLSRFRGIQKEKFHLHLKETEWRFNHRGENIYKILLKEFRKKPL